MLLGSMVGLLRLIPLEFLLVLRCVLQLLAVLGVSAVSVESAWSVVLFVQQLGMVLAICGLP